MSLTINDHGSVFDDDEFDTPEEAIPDFDDIDRDELDDLEDDTEEEEDDE